MVTAIVDINMLQMSTEEACSVMETIKTETNIHWHKASLVFMITGSFTEIQHARKCLMYVVGGRGPSLQPDKFDSRSAEQSPNDVEGASYTAAVNYSAVEVTEIVSNKDKDEQHIAFETVANSQTSELRSAQPKGNNFNRGRDEGTRLGGRAAARRRRKDQDKTSNGHDSAGAIATSPNSGHHKNECPICLDTFENPKTLKKCKHKFCTSCIDQALKVNNRCPVCKAPCGVLRGSQSPVAVASSSLPYFSRPCPSSSAPFQELGKDSRENECPICLDNFKNPKTLKKCQHKFCTSCIDQALKVNNRCPVCKAPCEVLRGSQSPVAVAFSSLPYFSRPCPSSSAPFQELGKDSRENECPICLDNFKNPKTLKKCQHKFCTSCIDQALKVNNRCPVCKVPCEVLRGSQSPVAVASSSLPYFSRPSPSPSAPFQELGKDNRGNECPICLDTMIDPKTLNKCQHKFCTSCIDQALNVNNRCPVCKAPCGTPRGNQPRGTMTSRVNRSSLPGHEGYGTITINYHFPSGIQTAEHPNPGQRYSGADREAYLPDSPEGREVLQLLRKTFDARLVFTVGTSVTSGRSNQTIWNDVHHKTSRHGGPTWYELSESLFVARHICLLVIVCLSVCLSVCLIIPSIWRILVWFVLVVFKYHI